MKKTTTILDRIMDDKAIAVAEAKAIRPLSELKASLSQRQTPVRDFTEALKENNRLHIIAEIKKASPSSGILDPNFDHLQVAQAYQASGLVDAVSVLTESKYFQGQLEFVSQVKNTLSVPLLRKDFIFDEYQVYESYLAEADAILLLVAALESDELRHLLNLTKKLGLHCLVEAHTAEEVEIAVDVGADIIGINARDLKTFKLNQELFAQLAPLIPRGKIKVAESGLETAAEAKQVFSAGANAALIGTSLMMSRDKTQKLQELLHF